MENYIYYRQLAEKSSSVLRASEQGEKHIT
jgi:hypothetical protein